MMTLGWPWPFLRKTNLVPCAFIWEKGKTMDFSETDVVYDVKVGRCSQLNKDLKLYEYQRSRSFTDVGPNRLDLIFFNFFSSITTRPFEAKFYVESLWDGGTKACSNGPGHMTKVAAMTIYGKKKKNLLWNLKADDLETWYAAPSTTKFVQVMPIGWPWLISRQGQIWSPTLLYGKKVKTMDFSEKIVVCYIKVGRWRQINEYMKLYEYQTSRSFTDLGPNHSDSIFLNVFSSIIADFNISWVLKWAIEDQWSSGCYYYYYYTKCQIKYIARPTPTSNITCFTFAVVGFDQMCP